ncbi:hypothetical protein PYCC9005_001354 [Savitreella phatthalungensis]
MSLEQYLTKETSLKGKTALVTGASRGIGAGIAVELGSRGADVVLSYTSESSRSKTEAVAGEIAQSGGGGRTLLVRADMRSLSALRSLADEAVAFGGGGLDILVNNAGISEDLPTAEETEDHFARSYDTNVRGPQFLTSFLVTRLREGGRIVNMSSVSARQQVPNQAVYAGTKAALEAMTRCWAKEFQLMYPEKKLTVNAVNPGPVQSDMWAGVEKNKREKLEGEAVPSGPRIGTPKDIAAIVAFLCTDAAQWVNASVINANGGMLSV